jgi:hypothetical protein
MLLVAMLSLACAAMSPVKPMLRKSAMMFSRVREWSQRE